MKLFEKIKSFLEPKKQIEQSSDVNTVNILNNLNNKDEKIYGTMFDMSQTDNSFNNMFAKTREKVFSFEDIITKQADKIKLYRNTSSQVDVSKAIDEIVNEVIFVYDDNLPLKISVNEENDKIKEKINSSFEKIMSLTNMKDTAHDIVRKSFIDGQLIFHASYDKKNTKNGIQEIKMIDPLFFYFDQKENVYKYSTFTNDFSLYGSSLDSEEEYSPEEIVRVDFGLYKDFLNLSYIEQAIKPANQLRLLEDMLIPLRFSRSISRRVFNVDIGDLPAKRGEEVMQKYIEKFKYKKYYDNKTGEITNQSHVTSMVEDYWFANRSGGKGTSVDVLDETGNLGEINDILYFLKKVYRSLNIPSSRIDINPDADKSFDYSSSQTTKEDFSFFMFISRIRKVYISAIKELMHRELVSTNVIKDSEWSDFSKKIEIFFTNENSFIEKMKLDTISNRMDIYNNLQEQQGKIFSVHQLMKDVFRLSDEEIEETAKEIEKEKKDKFFSQFYQSENEDF